MNVSVRPATYTRHYASPPQVTETGSRTWITRAANFAVVLSEVTEGAILARDGNPDEYMVFLPDVAASIEGADETIEAKAETLTIVPPGSSRIVAKGRGQVVRLFSNRATDLLARADNAAAYADGAPDVAPLTAWPEPVGGFRLRNYVVGDYRLPDTNMRVFRSTNLMINIMLKRDAARDTKKLSPHSHQDFEQASLVVAGDYIHHLRYPWTPDMSQWREDEHLEIGCPSVLIIPPNVVHTSRNVGDKLSWLVDIFAPPRVDFSKKPGFVLNAEDYPAPSSL
jgi:mannose-6-phosphate isomerase-like protein (cupin superfamily)